MCFPKLANVSSLASYLASLLDLRKTELTLTFKDENITQPTVNLTVVINTYITFGLVIINI